MPNRNQIGIVLGVAFLLLLPLLAMQLTRDVTWGPADFAVAGLLLVGTGLLFELAVRKANNFAYRAAVGIALAATLLLIWINLAVGIIGDEGNPANLMYAGVLAVGLIGAVRARFQPGGMARALFATALAQALVAVIAVGARLDATVLLDGFFAAMWIGSALLFQRASATGPRWAQLA
jgi:hypothetical protein